MKPTPNWIGCVSVFHFTYVYNNIQYYIYVDINILIRGKQTGPKFIGKTQNIRNSNGVSCFEQITDYVAILCVLELQLFDQMQSILYTNVFFFLIYRYEICIFCVFLFLFLETLLLRNEGNNRSGACFNFCHYVSLLFCFNHCWNTISQSHIDSFFTFEFFFFIFIFSFFVFQLFLVPI